LSTLQLSITGQEFAQVCGNLLAKAGELIRAFLVRTRQKPGNFGMLLLVGGSTRMPAFMGVLHGLGFTDQQIHKSNDVDKSVALGAAIHASQYWVQFIIYLLSAEAIFGGNNFN
jgi:molecular chaperone DnaK (HSP70)